MNKNFLRRLLCILVAIQIAQPLMAQQIPAQTTTINQESISKEVEKFLKSQIANVEGESEITIKPIDSRLKLQACTDLTSFLPPGSKAWGKVTVGLRCSTPKPWTIYIAAQVRVFGDYYVTKNAIHAGQIITEQDLVKIRGELSSQAPGTIVKINNAIGKTMIAAYPAGTSLRQDMFKLIPVIQQGQNIKVVSQGKGFRVSNDAIALNNASEGQLTRAKTNSGQLVSGIARAGGFIEVQ